MWTFVILLFYQFTKTLSQLQPLDFYTDESCATPSTENPTTSLGLEICLVTVGLGSVSIHSIGCTSGSVNIIGFSDISCGTPLDILNWFRTGNNCYTRLKGDIAAVMLTCNQINGAGTIDPGTPTSTSTIAIGPVAGGVATSAAASPTSGSNSNPLTSGFLSSTVPASSAPSSAPSSSSTASPSSNKLSQSDIIALGVGLGVGIPTILLALLAWCCPRPRLL